MQYLQESKTIIQKESFFPSLGVSQRCIRDRSYKEWIRKERRLDNWQVIFWLQLAVALMVCFYCFIYFILLFFRRPFLEWSWPQFLVLEILSVVLKIWECGQLSWRKKLCNFFHPVWRAKSQITKLSNRKRCYWALKLVVTTFLFELG